jgi:hypothetical protein
VTQRDAKRLACRITARLISNFYDVGATEHHADTDKDRERLQKALEQLEIELDRRAEGVPEDYIGRRTT